MPTTPTLGQEIKIKRTGSCWTQQDLADEVNRYGAKYRVTFTARGLPTFTVKGGELPGTNYKTVSRWENDDQEPSFLTLRFVKALLGGRWIRRAA